MKKKQITKLFAVMAMAASPAAAGTASDPWATSREVAPLDAAAASEAMAAVISIGYAALSQSREAPARPIQRVEASSEIVAARPRTTPSGAPACGNVATRAPRPVDCTPPAQVIMAGTPAAPSPTIAASAPAVRPASTGGAE